MILTKKKGNYMIKQLKIPKFKNENQERIFWSKIDLTKYFDKTDFSSIVFSNLKPSSRSISIRIPEYLLIRLKEQANELNIPYQSLIKMFLQEKISREYKS